MVLLEHNRGSFAKQPVMTEAAAEEDWDTVNGGFLDAVRVRDARHVHLEWVG